MSLQTKLSDLINAIGTDVKSLFTNQGSLASLNTTNKDSLVAAINEVNATSGSEIDDGVTALDSTWSSTKIDGEVTAAEAGAVSTIRGGVVGAGDTLNKVYTIANNNTTAVGNRVRYDAAQTLTTLQQLQACDNIGVGDPETDLGAIYTAAKA